MNNRPTIMIEPEISVTLIVSKKDKQTGVKRTFYELNLERDKIMYLPTTWTIVHEIDEESPLFNFSESEIKSLDLEWYILMQYHEESFAQKVYQIHSYTSANLKFNVQFSKATSFNEEGFTVLDHNELGTLIPLEKN
jgi:inward rectifier potassium channel